ncbi:MAG: class I SAM-dependent methyltransferase [Egibacteraceae bacterium]
MDADTCMEANQRQWDVWAPLKAESTFYDLEGFRRGGVRIPKLEREEVGDVAGKSLLHLQSHVGIDTLSWARLGASVTGMDFSSEAVTIARTLAAELELPATFAESNVYDLPRVLTGTFDVVYTSRGVLGWLPDLRRWAEVVAHFVAPGGLFYLFEVHPTAWIFDNEVTEPVLRPRYPYFEQVEPLRFEYQSTCAVPDAQITSVEYAWGHGLGEIVSSLVDAGLCVEFLHEWPFAFWRMLPFMECGDDGWWRLPVELPSIPLSFSLRAVKPA